MRAFLVLALALVPAARARADAAADALALARTMVSTHRSEQHAARFAVAFPPPGATPVTGEARIEARSGRYAVEDASWSLVLDAAGARLSLVARTHIPTFAARAARKRDSFRLEEVAVPIERARTVLLALELLAQARETPLGEEGAALGPDAPDLDESASSEEAWPRLALALGDEKGTRHALRHGAFAELARLVLAELGKERGLAPPLERDAALRRLVPQLAGASDAASRAAFILGDEAFPEAWPKLAALDFEEARDARAKIAALAGEEGRARLLALQARSASWDVRKWARERLGGTEWIAFVLANKDAPGEALEEAIAAVTSTDDAERLAPFAEDPRPSVRVEAAAALLRLTGMPRGRQLLEKAALDASLPEDVRETAIGRLAALVGPEGLAPTLGSIVSDPTAPPGVRAEAARHLDEAEATAAEPALAQALDGEIVNPGKDEPGHDLRVALVAALATMATKDALAEGNPASPTKREVALESLGRAASADPDDEVRALAIHAAGALGSKLAETIVKEADEVEGKRDPLAPRSHHATRLELDARSKDEGTRLLAIADAACEAPVRSVLERLVRAAREPRARAVLEGRLRARGEEGEAALEAIERR
jgi:hypothetical protein